MKRFVFIPILVSSLIPAILPAQNETDALRYSQHFPVGTARANGMGGAIGAVGGDFTGLSVNPAGIGFYSKSEFTFSPGIQWNQTASDFKTNEFSETRFGFNFGNFGYVSNYKINEQKGWISANFGFGYNKLNSFSRKVLMQGINNNSSLLDNFTHFANSSSDLNAFYEGLAYDVNLLPFDTLAGEYWNDPQNDGYGQTQRRTIDSRGNAGEYVFSFGANYNHRLYLGASLGITSVRFEQNIIHTESDQTDVINFMNDFVFYENLYTRGTGYTLKLGAIARPLNMLRVGFAYHLPTFYYLRDEFTTEMTASFDADANLNKQTALSPFGDYRYRLRSPSKIVGSAVLTIGKFAMLSADYEFLNYGNAKLEATDYEFFEENSAIYSNFGKAHNLKFGGEMRFGAAYLRGGYAWYSSPFVTEQPETNSRYAVYSAGTGFRTKEFFMDFSYSLMNNEERYYMYVPGMDDGSLNTSNLSRIMVTMGFRF